MSSAASGAPAAEGFVFADPDPLRADPAPNTPEVIAQTEFDDIDNTFDEPTRENVSVGLTEIANAVAGRGASLNSAIGSADPAFRYLRPVARMLAARRTELPRMVDELADTARLLAPVADQQVELLANAATTFAAVSADPTALRETISEGPATLETAIEVLPGQTRLLAKTATLTEDLLPGARALESALPVLNDAAAVGTPVLARTPPLRARPGGGVPRARSAGRRPFDEGVPDQAHRPARLGQAAGRVGRPGADRLQLLELLLHLRPRDDRRRGPGRVHGPPAGDARAARTDDRRLRPARR